MSRLRLLAGGDVFIGGRMKPLLEEGRLEEVLGDLKPLLATADLAIANFEAAVGDAALAAARSDALVSPPEAAASVRMAGITVVGLANNHALDLGSDGLQRTLEVLGHAGLMTVGAGMSDEQMVQPLLRPLGLDVAVLAYFGTHRRLGRPGTNGAPLARMVAEVSAARRQVPNVVVMLHWGRLEQQSPTNDQVRIAHALIDSGAAIVLGSGPHSLMPIERYRQGLIAYSLGNLAFDMRGMKRRLSCLVGATLDEGQVVAVEVHPVLSDDGHCTRLLAGEREPQLQGQVRGLLVNSLQRIESDSFAMRRTFQRFGKNPQSWLKKQFARDRRANSLWDYARSLLVMIKELVSPR
jgi:poly-gamma-glutamate synthesis protein (capsule biosynthesis protein)